MQSARFEHWRRDGAVVAYASRFGPSERGKRRPNLAARQTGLHGSRKWLPVRAGLSVRRPTRPAARPRPEIDLVGRADRARQSARIECAWRPNPTSWILRRDDRSGSLGLGRRENQRRADHLLGFTGGVAWTISCIGGLQSTRASSCSERLASSQTSPLSSHSSRGERCAFSPRSRGS
jgi:hypothetical protein